MKKHAFYSVVLGTNRKPIAKLWTGWTDGTYNYYKDEFNKWHTIEPSTGLSTGYPHNTRTEAAAHVHTIEMAEKIKNAIKPEMVERFKTLVEIAEKEELKAC